MLLVFAKQRVVDSNFQRERRCGAVFGPHPVDRITSICYFGSGQRQRFAEAPDDSFSFGEFNDTEPSTRDLGSNYPSA